MTHPPAWSAAPHDPVIVIVPVTRALRREHHLSPDAHLAVMELYEGTEHVCCTDCDARQGVEAAARAWAESTGAAYAGTVAV